MIPIKVDVFGTVPKRLEKKWRNWKSEEESWPYSIVETGQDTEESAGELRGLAITQTKVKAHQLTQVGTTRNE